MVRVNSPIAITHKSAVPSGCLASSVSAPACDASPFLPAATLIAIQAITRWISP